MSTTKQNSLLVTGGLGFIGSQVVERFHPKFEIIVLDWDNETDIAKQRAAKYRKEGISVHQKDLADAKTWETVEPCNFIFHAAAQTAAVSSEEAPDRDLLTNSLGTQLVAEYARRNSSNVIFCNTIRVYDSASVDEILSSDQAIAEDCPTILERSNWSPPFAYSKYSGECTLRWYSEKYDLKVISHRMSGIVGSKQMSSVQHGWVSYLIKCAIDKQEYTIFGDGNQSRDILHIDDYLTLIEKELSRFESFSERGFEVYNVGGGPTNRISVNQLIKILNSEPYNLNLVFKCSKARKGEPKHYVSELSKINKILSKFNETGPWPRIDKSDIISELVNHYLNLRARSLEY